MLLPSDAPNTLSLSLSPPPHPFCITKVCFRFFFSWPWTPRPPSRNRQGLGLTGVCHHASYCLRLSIETVFQNIVGCLLTSTFSTECTHAYSLRKRNLKAWLCVEFHGWQSQTLYPKSSYDITPSKHRKLADVQPKQYVAPNGPKWLNF